VTWIRVDTHRPQDNALLTFRERLGCSFAQAVGHHLLIELWIADNHPSGNISHVLHEQLEAAAIWRGEPDLLALAFLDAFCEDGRVRGWLDRQGKLLAWKEADRRRKAMQRSDGHSAGQSARQSPRKVEEEKPGPSERQSSGQSPGPLARQPARPSLGPSARVSRG